MKKELGLVVIALAILVGVSATWSLAQQKQSPPPDRERIERERTIERQAAPDGDVRFEIESEMQGPDGPLPPGMPGDFVFLATEMSFGGKLVKGAPYSGQAVTESVQTLSDGNRIVDLLTIRFPSLRVWTLSVTACPEYGAPLTSLPPKLISVARNTKSPGIPGGRGPSGPCISLSISKRTSPSGAACRSIVLSRSMRSRSGGGDCFCWAKDHVALTPTKMAKAITTNPNSFFITLS